MAKIITFLLLRVGIASVILNHALHQFDVYLIIILLLILLLKSYLKFNNEEYPIIIKVLTVIMYLIFFGACCIDENGDSKDFYNVGVYFVCIKELFVFIALDILFDEYVNIKVFKNKDASESWLFKSNNESENIRSKDDISMNKTQQKKRIIDFRSKLHSKSLKNKVTKNTIIHKLLKMNKQRKI